MRKMHYNEGLNIKLARQLIASELEEDEDADEEMRDDTEETEEISVDPPQEGEQSSSAPVHDRGNDSDSFQSGSFFYVERGVMVLCI